MGEKKMPNIKGNMRDYLQAWRVDIFGTLLEYESCTHWSVLISVKDTEAKEEVGMD